MLLSIREKYERHEKAEQEVYTRLVPCALSLYWVFYYKNHTYILLKYPFD